MGDCQVTAGFNKEIRNELAQWYIDSNKEQTELYGTEQNMDFFCVKKCA